MTTALAFRDVNAFYGPAQALFGMQLTVGAGETVALLGRNGAGKTTTMRAAMNILVRRTGEIDVLGEPAKGTSDRIARRGVGWVPDDRRIFPTLTVRENLLLAQKSARAKDREPVEFDEVLEILPIMKRLIDRRGSALSGGEQQAVAIARAIVARPRLLLLDEPTEGLAPVIVEELQRAVADLPGRFGMSILLAEQNLAFVQSIAQQVLVLETGRLVYSGTAAEFAADPSIRERFLAIGSA
ncbi:ABC transporter ATP-binding protein [Microbacterium sp. RD1]|uniref:ABC transporter ATP-binding protein n=1 Tax=Microbacterium sp. RD1 TaxID=3457313 RepID=UPI003FA5E48B